LILEDPHEVVDNLPDFQAYHSDFVAWERCVDADTAMKGKGNCPCAPMHVSQVDYRD
jgi:hypothetical protein